MGEIATYDHLVLVPGHAVWIGGPPDADSSWTLAPYQAGEGRAFAGHLRVAVEAVVADPRAWLVTSGGCTRPEQPERSEAHSYLALAAAQDWFGHGAVAARASAEPRARDSYENLLFGLLAFRERHARWPRRVTVSGWGFKAPRFNDHAAALGWPLARFQYRGSGTPGDPPAAARAERVTRELFRDSLNSAELVEKRRRRSLFRAPRLPEGVRLSAARFAHPLQAFD
ncbi:MAG: YdcF family protein [Planctomycetota bacterium]